jgi:DNA end-binding protein Ku
MPRAIWSGNVSFGLVTIPVKLYSAVKQRTVRFHQLHASDNVRIEQKRICPADGDEVSYSEIVKGFEIAPERYVVIEPQELAALLPAKSSTIEIEDFVELSEIDPIYYDSAYYLAPGPGAEKPYQLLREAMRDCDKVAIARVVLRSKEHLVAIRASGDVLAMETMNFADEIVDAEQLEGLDGLAQSKLKLSSRERDIARRLVESLSVSFDASKYQDTYREAVLEMIERKANGEEIAEQPQIAPRTTAPDLMSALQASLEEVRSRSGAPPSRRGKAKAAPTKGSKATPKKSASSTPKSPPARSKSAARSRSETRS